MEKPDLLRKLESMLDLVKQNREWGNIEIEFQSGTAVRVRKSVTEKLSNPENNRARYENR
jgi:hypothetical protein